MLVRRQINGNARVAYSAPAFEEEEPVYWKETAQYKRILIPFTDSHQLVQTFEPVLDMVEEKSAELVLLRICASSAPETCREVEESLYSELRGVQAQLQTHPLSAKIEMVIGPATKSIVGYASRHNVDLIVMPGQDEAITGWKSGKNIAGRVARQACCDTYIVD